MVRLAVVDRRQLAVPFDFREACGVTLAFNGEVYNWRALRSELSDGIPWETDCDAEVVARAWRRWGPAMLKRLNGMFGLAIIDEHLNQVFLARDRAGEKPLYYAPLGNGLCFASEVKALPIRFEECPCLELDTLEFDCLEATPFQGVKCLGPGEYIHLQSILDLNELQTIKWWQLPTEVDDSMSFRVAVDRTEELLVDAIRIRTVSEVPIAVQLSGGLDSAIIQKVARADKLYVVTFPKDGVDNYTLAMEASDGWPVTSVTFGLEDVERELVKIAYHLDTPATWTAVAQWFMNQRIAVDGNVVVLSGEGADELFGGYSRYRFLWHFEHTYKDKNLASYASIRHVLFGSPTDIMSRMLNRGVTKTVDHARELVERFRGDGNDFDVCADMARVDFYTTMQCLLRMADRMSAAFSLENRSPFLDYRLMELAARMPTRHKITEKESKAVLREVARRLGVSEKIVDDRTKKGLFIPWNKWGRGASGARGQWDRTSFAAAMMAAWRKAFSL